MIDADRRKIDKAQSLHALSDIARDIQARMETEGASAAEMMELDRAIRVRVDHICKLARTI